MDEETGYDGKGDRLGMEKEAGLRWKRRQA